MGVHPILGTNVHMTDTSNKAFRTRLHRYAIQGRYMPNWYVAADGFSTVGARIMKETNRYWTVLSPSHPEFLEELVSEYVDLIEDGAEALQHDGGSAFGYLDFNPNVPTSPDRSLPQGVRATHEEFLRRARAINPNVALSLQEAFDRNFPYNDVACLFGWEDAKDPITPLRTTFPEWNFVVGAMFPGQYDRLNNALRHGLVWAIAAREHSASLDEKLTRPLSRYLSELIRIRKRYADILFHGRFNDTNGAHVTGDAENIRYSVFTPVDAENAERACVIVNFGDREETADVSIVGKDGAEATICTPFVDDRVTTLPLTLTLPPHHAAVVVVQ
jgi:hypothetical protein